MLQVPGNNLMGGIDMTTAAPANVANVANAPMEMEDIKDKMRQLLQNSVSTGQMPEMVGLADGDGEVVCYLRYFHRFPKSWW